MVLLFLILLLLLFASVILSWCKVCYIITYTVFVGTLSLLHTLLISQTLIFKSIMGIHILNLSNLSLSTILLPCIVLQQFLLTLPTPPLLFLMCKVNSPFVKHPWVNLQVIILQLMISFICRRTRQHLSHLMHLLLHAL